MATESRRPAKNEVLSMRIDSKTRFLLDILARYRGQSISTVVERAILEAADNTHIGNIDTPKTWRDYWHINEGVRALNMAADQGLFPTYDEELRFEFAKTHWPFFYLDRGTKYPRPAYIDVLWPRIDFYVEMWEKTKATDYFATGKAMQKALSGAGVAPPDWPTKPPEKVTTIKKDDKSSDLDDEIPF